MWSCRSRICSTTQTVLTLVLLTLFPNEDRLKILTPFANHLRFLLFSR